MFLILTKYDSSRLRYILDEIFVHRFGLEYKITENEEYFHKSVSLKINYGTQIIEGCMNIPSVNLLFEDDIKKQYLEVEEDRVWHKVFFKQAYDDIPDFRKETHFIHFDIFAAAFYLLSRYEEYLTHKHDLYNRYSAENSLAFKNDFLEFPLVDHWLKGFSTVVKKQYPNIKLQTPNFKQLNTFDLDFPYKYRGLSYFRNIKKLLSNFSKAEVRELFLHLNTVLGKTPDPFDTYSYIESVLKNKNIETYFFFLLAAKEHKHDKNQSPSSKAFKQLLKNLSNEYQCGLHPSYQSGFSEKILKQEFETFKSITGKPAIISRFHFLKIHLPESYQKIIKNGAREDYSLAYSHYTGFRASTSLPFHFFDLVTNETTTLLIYPPCVMDVTLKNFLKLGPEEAIEKIKHLKETVKKVNGTFISIWHNSSLAEDKEWKGWRRVFESLFE